MNKRRERWKLLLLRSVFGGIILLSSIAVTVNIVVQKPYDLVLEMLPITILVVFMVLFVLNLKGFLLIPSLVLIGILSLPAYYLLYRWGNNGSSELDFVSTDNSDEWNFS